MSEPLLHVRGLCASYGKVEALYDIDLTVHSGQVVTVIGANGAGKTTLLAAIMGALPAGASADVSARGAASHLIFAGRSLARASIAERVALGLTLVPEKRELFGAMSVEDNLLLGGFPHYRLRFRALGGQRDPGTSSGAIDDVFALFPKLRERRRQLAGTLSGGERQMLALGRALMARPKLLMLDEPSLGLAPLIVREIFHTIFALKQRGTAILLVEQNARAALQVADFGYVLETGSVALSGPAAELADDARVIESYLGLGDKSPQR